MPVKSEDERAILYRNQNDARIAFRANQIRALAPDPAAFELLWRNYRKVYDPTNYIEGEDYLREEDFMAIFDYDNDDGNISASQVHLRHVRRPNK
ncbi:MAG TPA: hypothetical protein VK756_07735 [Solirubrobacteraceae bacterium]|jgi:hypothetical protein|nr:hypothetical protein [Solirubrobacteraceae bacterium]